MSSRYLKEQDELEENSIDSEGEWEKKEKENKTDKRINPEDED